MKKLPKKIYVKWEEQQNDEDYLLASENTDGMASFEGKETCGLYELREVVTMVNKTEVIRK